MNTITTAQEIKSFEKLLMLAEVPPWSALYRVTIGFVGIPALHGLGIEDQSGWVLVPFLLGLLLMLRVLPTAVRKLLPFSDTMKEIWAERRQLAKRYDSYQWQKLFWIGVGLGLYTGLSSHPLTSWVVVSISCVLSGAFGKLRWRAVSSPR